MFACLCDKQANKHLGHTTGYMNLHKPTSEVIIELKDKYDVTVMLTIVCVCVCVCVCVLQEVVAATLDLEDVRSYRGEACQPHMVSGLHPVQSTRIS